MTAESKFLAKVFFLYTVMAMLAACGAAVFDLPVSAFKWAFLVLAGQVALGAWLVWTIFFKSAP